MEERTGWRGQNESQIIGEEKKNCRLVGAAETSKERAEWRRLQRENLNKSSHDGGESQGGREPHLGESEGDQSESMERKG